MSDVSIWMPLYVGDMQSKTTRLDTLQIGALHLLTLDYWKNGAVPDVASVLANITKMTPAKFKTIRAGLLSCGVFEVVDSQWVSPYLDGLREAATENKKEKSERAVKAAQARWAKTDDATDKPSNASASTEQCASNADAMQVHMLEHATSNAKNMLEQCPSSSSSSIKNTHTNAGEFLPDLEQLNTKLKMAGGQAITQQQLDQVLVTFSPHYETQALTHNQLVGKLVTWVKGDQDKAKRTTSKPVSTKPVASGGDVNSKWQDQVGTPQPVTAEALAEMEAFKARVAAEGS